MSITRTFPGVSCIPGEDVAMAGITMVSSDKVTLEPGEAKLTTTGMIINDGTAVVPIDMVDGSSHVSTHNPWADILAVILGHSESVQMEMSKEEWLSLESRLTSSMQDIGYNHKVELAKARTNTVVTFHHDETNRVVMMIHISDDNYAVSDSKADEFADSLKDL